MKTMVSRTVLIAGASALVIWALSCGSSGKDEPFNPPVGGSGGYGGNTGGGPTNPGGYGASNGSGNSPGDGGSGGEAGGQQSCASEYKRCEHEFTYPAGSETSVEVRGSFTPDGWDNGFQLTKSGSVWSATVPIPYEFEITYKFVIDGGTWVVDPANPVSVPDGQGGQKSVLAPKTCDEWDCVTDPAPGNCPESTRTCPFKFVYPYGGESSARVMGSFDNWGDGVPMTHVGSQWTATVDGLEWGSTILYKFSLDGSNDWVPDPHNDDQDDDGFGGYNSRISSVSCEWWSCGSIYNPDAFDWRDAVLYFVFTDRFFDGNPANNGSPTGGVDRAADYHGGDFAGITAKINEGYFTDLGVNALWISPPMNNTSKAGAGDDGHMYSAYHGYWVSDFESTEERFGTMAELVAMVKAAHARDIKVLIDYPMNHCHTDAAVYTQHPDWFNQPPCVCKDNPSPGECRWDGEDGKRCWFTEYLPDFNFNNNEARNWSINNVLWWIEQTGIDGFRLDAVKHIENSWLLDLRSRLKNEVESVTGEKVYLVGETFDGRYDVICPYVSNSMLDGQFDFPLRSVLVQTVLMRIEAMGDLHNGLNEYETACGASAIMSPFVGNHDMPRPIHFAQNTRFSDDVWYNGKDRNWNNQPGLPSEASAFERLANAFTVLFTIKGVPLVYYGDEIGLPGAGDPDNRRDMQWTGTNAAQNGLREHIKKLGKIRADHAPLRRGTRSQVHISNDVYAYKMSYLGSDVYVVVNRADSQQSVSGLPSGSLTNLLMNTTVNGPTFNVPARSSMILVP